ncbi:arylamine N-acetyltransferase [Sphaerisporangium krabiense]|uniref:Arylamine N-acetyltransferase n=1 Tax=Sphaerisporangium krabiense TaxID=763782 RepID=A0A7W9DMN3_9ACTN|nr:arylamine N-acetyltransferase [Sphaerisporangium krabiense]MBB5624532.1 arylamine N-acetyltransferase [Sphaerisporangium krabiense]GII61512.1 arylamine N-acetyltransferase [Sphaerisporangium krabiense]
MTDSLDATVSPLVPRYLRRLRLDDLTGPPSPESLARLHRAHVERVPYETFHIWLRHPTTVDALESAGRVLRGRGGYCYHLNGALALLLEALGYQVTRHMAGVQGSAADPAGARGNHLALTVSGLPTAANPGGGWLVDVGLGDGPHEPVPLVEGVHRQGAFAYGLRPSEAEPGGWRLEHDPSGSFLGMDLRPGAVPMSAFTARHEQLSTSPDSSFMTALCVQRRDAAGADTLRGLVLTRTGSGATRTTLPTPRDYFEALADVFGLTLEDVDPREKDALWERLTEAHESWLATRAS